MIADVFSFIDHCLGTAAQWFVMLLDVTGSTSYYLTFIFVLLVGKFILAPLFGSSQGSDKAKKKSGNNKQSGNNKKSGGKNG